MARKDQSPRKHKKQPCTPAPKPVKRSSVPETPADETPKAGGAWIGDRFLADRPLQPYDLVRGDRED